MPLRLFEGCARGYLGRVEGATIGKLARFERKVAYLSYPDFETDPHPALTEALTVNLRLFGCGCGSASSTGTCQSWIASRRFSRRIIRYGPNLDG